MDKRRRFQIALALAFLATASLLIGTSGSLLSWPYAVLCLAIFVLLLWAATKISPGSGLRRKPILEDNSKSVALHAPKSQDEA